MEAMIRIAKAYYERSDEMEKKKVDKFLCEELSHDRKASRTDVEKLFQESRISNVNDILQGLEFNKEGYLNPDSVVALYYMNKIGIIICNGCGAGMYGMYFCCKKCLGKGKSFSFDLCCDCYTKGVKHEHPIKDFSDNHSLVHLLRDPTTAKENKQIQSKSRANPTTAKENGLTQRKREIEQLQQIAKAFLKACPEKVKDRAHKFYNSMDIDKKGTVNLEIFRDFLNREGYPEMGYLSELYQDGDKLSFDDVITLLYVIASGRPICNGCKKFIPGVFFTCEHCMASPRRAFNLCKACYEEKKYPHTHHGKFVQLLDNHMLLQLNILGKPGSVVLETSVTANYNKSTPQSSNPSNSSRTIMIAQQPPDNTATIKTAFQELLICFNAAVTLTATLAGCTIM